METDRVTAGARSDHHWHLRPEMIRVESHSADHQGRAATRTHQQGIKYFTACMAASGGHLKFIVSLGGGLHSLRAV